MKRKSTILLCSLISMALGMTGCDGEVTTNNGGEQQDLDLDLAEVAYSGEYDDLRGRPTLFDGQYGSLSGVPDLATVALSGDYEDLVNRPTLSGGETVGGKVTQTPESLIDDGPLGEYVVLDWEGDSNVVIDVMGSGVVPKGRPFLVEIPRTIADSGGPDGHGTQALGNYVEFRDGESIEARANNNISYRATPNANDWRGDNAALFELLEFVPVGGDRFILTRLPEPRTGYTHGEPEHSPGTTSRTGFAWERRADGTTHLTNGTVRIPAHNVGGGQPRFRLDFVWPFRFEQHHGNHRTVQMGISTKTTDVYWSALSVPRNSSTDREGMRVTVYVDPGSQNLVASGDSVAVIIMATGNWRLPSDQW